jgi:hypothetical protein
MPKVQLTYRYHKAGQESKSLPVSLSRLKSAVTYLFRTFVSPCHSKLHKITAILVL